MRCLGTGRGKDDVGTEMGVWTWDVDKGGSVVGSVIWNLGNLNLS